MKRMFVLVGLMILLTGCGLLTEAKECSEGYHLSDSICIKDETSIGEFKNAEDVLALYEAFNEKQSNINSFYGRGVFLETTDMLGAPTEASPQSDDVTNDYSGTNNQVQGVDELDNVLTDGEYIYVRNYNGIQIVAVDEDNLTYVKSINDEDLSDPLESFYVIGMYVDEDRLIVLGDVYTNICNESKYTTEYIGCDYYNYNSSTRVLEFEKDNFTLVNQYELSGNYVGSRKIGDSLYVVTNEYIPFYLMNNENYDFSLDDYLPNHSVNDINYSSEYDDILYVAGTNPTSFTTFYGINLSTKNVSIEVVLGEGGYNLYVSSDSMYLTYTKWDWNEKAYDLLVKAVDKNQDYNDIEILDDPYDIKTVILKIDIDDSKVSFHTTGEVEGTVLNQFSMDEYNGNVRIVTTTSNWWWGSNSDIENSLYILNDDLELLSSLSGIGKPGESVQSTRFVGDYAYVVTFLRTDPFYVIDVSDPYNPKKLSELEIPGFSSYLQPLNEDFILGIGFGDMDGGTRGLKISLYDVTDKENAIEVSKVVYPYAENGYIWSSSTYNHKDLLVSINKGIIVLPYVEYNWENNSNNTTTGAIVLNVNLLTKSLVESGKVIHSQSTYADAYVYKAKYINNYLYTISSQYIKVSPINEPGNILQTIQIGQPQEVIYYD